MAIVLIISVYIFAQASFLYETCHNTEIARSQIISRERATKDHIFPIIWRKVSEQGTPRTKEQ